MTELAFDVTLATRNAPQKLKRIAMNNIYRVDDDPYVGLTDDEVLTMLIMRHQSFNFLLNHFFKCKIQNSAHLYYTQTEDRILTQECIKAMEGKNISDSI